MINPDFKIGIIGAGKLASNLSIYAQQFNKLEFIVARSEKSQQHLLNLGINDNLILNSINEINPFPEICIIAVNDDSISSVVGDLVNFHSDKISNKLFIHCSGVLTADVLINLESYGAKIAACHPFQTFYVNRNNLLSDVPWGIDCDDEDFNLIKDLISFFDGKPIKLSEISIEKKALYHASAVATSNFLISSIELANLCAKESGIDAKLFIRKLAETSLQNALESIERSDELPLTGPIARGDTQCISNHLSQLETTNLSHIYKALANANLEIALLKDKIGIEKYNEISELLKF